MRILVACEESQAVTVELRRLGHEAYSCDILECSGGHPEWHIMQDVLPLLNGDCEFASADGQAHVIYGKWDMIIAFPPCTHLAVSGAAHFAKKIADGRQQKGIEFFMRFANADFPRIAIENPIGIMSKKWRKPDQIIQPWWFGDNVGKSTCLWLKGLPLLKQEVMERPPVEYHTWVTKDGRTKRQEMWFYQTRCLPHSERGKAASKTFPGFAKAMAKQWAGKAVSEMGKIKGWQGLGPDAGKFVPVEDGLILTHPTPPSLSQCWWSGSSPGIGSRCGDECCIQQGLHGVNG